MLRLHSNCQHAAAQRQGQRVSAAVVARAMPFQLPSAAQRLLKSNPLRLPQQLPVPPQQPPSTPQQPEQQQQQWSPRTADGPVAPAPGTSTFSASPSSGAAALKFAKHLANVSNGCAPPMSRFESTGWLLFESKRLQSALIGPTPHTVNSWVCNAAGLQLLEQIYLVGAAIAELGTADGLQPLSSSNGSRAIVSLDYSRLLERYLQQHGHLLAEEFWSGLHAFDDLQARAIHVSTALETRCMVHTMLFDKLIERVGTEGTSAAAAWGGSWSAPGSAPLATAITNTMINTTQQHSAPVTTQSTVAAPSAVNSNSGNNSNVASSESTTAAAQSGVHGVWGYIGQLGAVFLLLCTAAGKVVQVVIAVVSFAKDVVLQLLMLRAVSAGAKAVAAKAKAGGDRPALAFAGAGGSAGSLPGAGALQQARQLPAAGAGASYGTMQPPAVAELLPAGAATSTGLTAGSLGLLGAVTLRQQQPQPAERKDLQQQQPGLWPQPGRQQQEGGAPAAPGQQQHQQQWELAVPPVHPTVAWAGSQPASTAVAAAQQQQRPQPSAAAGHGSSKQRSPVSPQQRLRQGLQGGLGAAQSALGKAAARVSATAAAIPSALHSQYHHQQQQQHRGSGGFKAGSRNLLYSLWSPSEAGLQEMETDAADEVQFADAGWGAGGSAVGVAVGSTEEAGW